MYCIMGWGLPAVIVGVCSVLDFTGASPMLHIRQSIRQCKEPFP